MSLSYLSLLDELRTRTSHAHASLLAPQSKPLRRWMETTLGGEPGAPGGLVASPVFEHKFGFTPHAQTLDALCAQGLLHPRLVDQMDAPATGAERFGRDWHPYTHQVAAWQAVQANRSVVVSAGTGAGKTECFLVPILNDLVQQAVQTRSRLEGVQALFLYPLNALINSQRDRLSAWTRGLDGSVRYCLYNGETPATEPARLQREEPERVLDRRGLRESPPPLLITNATMLEYMLVRPEDDSILAASEGKLRYIVIDEAHTYVGSMAAELALLLRRVMNAFGVEPSQVRFIATSATLSSGKQADATAQVQRFLADLSGQPTERVEVITDTRHIPAVVHSDDEAYRRLATNPAALTLREALVARSGQTLPDLAAATGLPEREVLTLLDQGTQARPSPKAEAFLPLRGHLFTRGLQGLWTCMNPDCSGRHGDLSHEDWLYGAVFTSREERCPHCAARVFEMALCTQCGHEHLIARQTSDLGAVVPGSADLLQEVEEDRLGAEWSDELPSSEPPASQVSLLARADHTPEGHEDPIAIDLESGDLDGDGPRFRLIEQGTQHCARCGYKGRAPYAFCRAARTGRSFALGVSVPTLLQFMPPQAKSLKPWQGRRTISFTDSRQGTARFAARAQGEAERNFIRSFVYHQLRGASPSAETIRRKQDELVTLEAMVASLPAGSDVATRMLQDKRDEVARAQATPSVPLPTVAIELANTEEFKQLYKHWQRYLPFQSSGKQGRELAQWLVLREFARRPMRAASLETMGLVSVGYRGVVGRTPPTDWARHVGADADRAWADFLHLCMDFYVRSNTALHIQDANEFFRWMGTQITIKAIGGPDREGIRNKRVTWPRAGTNSRLEGLLRRALDLRTHDSHTDHLINDIFRTAWEQLRSVEGLFWEDGSLGGLLLEPAAMELTLVDEAWLCPVTRTLLARTLCGHSPYQPAKDLELSTLCTAVTMPAVPWAGGHRSMHATRESIAHWLQTDATVAAARALGAVSEFTERIWEFVEYYQTAEHSAQISSAALKSAERDFKRGDLNLLSCSTTMEMGVDIGNLTGVAMNNAPPNPANFLQRVGRAGRRGEPAAVSLTVCRQLPHDQAVFDKPDWAFRTPIHITPVKLDSRPIVERHVRAAVLTAFLRDHTREAHFRLTAGWLLVGSESEMPIFGHLITWLGHQDTAACLADDLQRLVSGSILDGTPTRTLLANACSAFVELADRFHRGRQALVDALEALPEEERTDSPAAYAIQRQLFRMEGEYLLSYLADEQVLPGYGFPSGVLPFVSTTLEELRAIKQADDKRKARRGGDDEDIEVTRARIDARARLAGVASRDLPMAIREYAPGNTVVLGRRSYRSRGVRLAWQLPASATESDLSGIQSLQTAWRCKRCGTAGTTTTYDLEACTSCGSEEQTRVPFLQPSGFATDLMEDAVMDATPATFVPVTRPWISSGVGTFRTLGRPSLLRYRHTSRGTIVHLSAGAHRCGYALCLRCGRAEPETAPDGKLPTAMVDHYRLRGGKGSSWKRATGIPCEGNETGWAVRRHLRLGGSIHTDVLELHLREPDTGVWCNDPALLTTIAVALRAVSAAHLGVDERELGYSVATRRGPAEEPDAYRAILLFDTASGGAGFVAQLPEALPTLLARAAKLCATCPNACGSVCHGCLLSNDTQHDTDLLDRHLVAPAGTPTALLGDAFLDALSLEPRHAVLTQTAHLWTDPTASLLHHARQALRSGPVEVRLFATVPEDAEPLQWRGRPLLQQLAAMGNLATVVLCLPSTDLDWQRSRQLASLLDTTGVRLQQVPVPRDHHLHRWAELRTPTTTRVWCTDAPPSLNRVWLDEADAVYITGLATRSSDATDVCTDQLLTAPDSRVQELNLAPAARGKAHGFGTRFLATLDDQVPGWLDTLRQRGPADSLEVYDRYLQSPLAAQALYSVLQALRDEGTIGPGTRLHVHTLQPGHRDGVPSRVHHDWRRNHEGILRQLLQPVHSDAEVSCHPRRERQAMPHARSIELSWGPDELEIRLDQGFGFLMARGDDRFPFVGSEERQVSALLEGRWELTPRGHGLAHPAYLIRD